MADEYFRPTVLVGVGGTGCKIAERVFAEALSTEIGRGGKIVVLGFDTDDNDMRRLASIQRSNRIRFSSPETVGSLTTKYDEIISPWFHNPASSLPEQIKNLSLIDGAAQIRMFTHLALFTKLVSAEIPQKIGDALASLGRYDGSDSYDGVVNVMMVGSLAGATGSGSFIQIAMLIQEAAKNRNVSADVRGVFLLPDVYVHGASLPVYQIPNVLANGYAALKELNCANMLASGDLDNKQVSYEYAPDRTIQKGEFPFQSMTLIDFESETGGSLGRSIDSYTEMAKRAVYQQIFSPIGGRVRSVEVNDARAKYAAAAQGADNKFASAGVGALVYPVDAVAEYLSLQFAIEALSGDWIRLDRQFQARTRRFRGQREQGNVLEKPPEKSSAYIEDLRNLALNEKNAFFVEIYQNVHSEAASSANSQSVSTPEIYLDAITQQVIEGFWSFDQLSEARSRSNIDESQLKSPATLSSTVRDLEYALDEDLRKIETLVRSRPTDVFQNILSNADDVPEAVWQDHHIQTYIIKNGPHLVQIRYFVYSLLELLKKRSAELDPEAVLLRLYSQSNVFDPDRGSGATERGTPKTIDEAAKAAKTGVIASIFSGGIKAFAEQYATYFNNSKRFTKQYAEQSVKAQLYSDIETELVQLERVLEGFVGEVESLMKGLERKVNREQSKHVSSGVGDGSLFVYADVDAKLAMWDNVRTQTSGSRQDTRVNAEISDAIYKQYREARRKTSAIKSSVLEDVRTLFSDVVIDGFAKRVINEEMSEHYKFDIIEALRRQAELKELDFEAHLRELVLVVSRQSDPLIKLVDPLRNGQRITYWAVHPDIKEAIADDRVFEDLFTLNQGEAPLIMDEFSKSELLCMNSVVNLELKHLSKLHPGESYAVGMSQGKYSEAYDDLVENLLEADLEQTAATAFTPHIHRDWHRPGLLPEIHKGKAEKQLDDIYRAFVFANASGVLALQPEYGANVAEFNTIGRVKIGGVRHRIVDSGNFYDILLAFERRSDLVGPTVDFWNEYSAARLTRQGVEARDFDDIELVQSLVSSGLLGQLLEVSYNRREAADRDPRTRRLVKVWAGLIADMVDEHEGHKAIVGRAQMIEAIVTKASRATLEELKAHFQPESFADLETLTNQGLSDFRESRLV